MKDTKALGLAIVGFGGMGSQHARTLQTVKEMEVRGVWDIAPPRRKAAQEMGLGVYGSLAALLADAEVEVALIATPNHLHKELSIAVLRAGKHVICEKPVTLNAGELEEILAEANRLGRVFVVHQNRRWDEDFRSVKRVYDEGGLGKVFRIESRIMGSQGIPGDWRTKREFGGGMLLDWGIHLIDQVMWMAPERIKRVYCRLGYVLGGECDDSVQLFLTFESGLEALVEVGTWNMESLPRWYMAGMGGAMTIEDFWFTKSSVTRLRENSLNSARPVDAGKGITKTMAPRDAATLEKGPAPHDAYDVRDFYRNVAAAIHQKEALIVDPAQSLRVMRVMDAARRSARQDRPVEFE